MTKDKTKNPSYWLKPNAFIKRKKPGSNRASLLMAHQKTITKNHHQKPFRWLMTKNKTKNLSDGFNQKPFRWLKQNACMKRKKARFEPGLFIQQSC
jgi:hypothetical protein